MGRRLLGRGRQAVYQNGDAPVPFSVVPVLAGPMGRMTNSVIHGFMFAWIASQFTESTAGLLISGAVLYGAVLMLMTWFILLTLVHLVMASP